LSEGQTPSGRKPKSNRKTRKMHKQQQNKIASKFYN